MIPVAPRVSVLLAVHNDERFLPATLASVLGQSMRDFEIIAVDDASTDTTPQLLRAPGDPRLRYSRNEQNLGQVPSLNRGLAACRAPLVARIDGDDVCEPDRLEQQLRYLQARPELVGCGTWTIEIDPEDRVIGQQEPPDDPAHVRWSLCHTNRLYHPSMMLRRDALLQAGGYDERFPASEDYEMWTRLIAGGASIGVVPQRLIRYRRRPGSISDRHRDRQRCFTQQIATRYVSALLGRAVSADQVALMGELLSWRRPSSDELLECHRDGRLKSTLRLIALLRRQLLSRASAAAQRAAEDEIATHLERHARRLLRDAPSVALPLSWAMLHLPHHRPSALRLLAMVLRCLRSGR